MLAISINAGNTKNGNPRRGWIIANNEGEFVDFIDEGYQGLGALKLSPYANAVPTPTIMVEASVYKVAYAQAYGSIKGEAKRENKLYRKLR
jgi:hypothetical protein